MASSPLERIPLEILQGICEIVASEGKASVYDFALTDILSNTSSYGHVRQLKIYGRLFRDDAVGGQSEYSNMAGNLIGSDEEGDPLWDGYMNTGLYMETQKMKWLADTREIKHGNHWRNPYEYALITSPSLHSIVVHRGEYELDGKENFISEALGDIIPISPRLREVYIYENFAYGVAQLNQRERPKTIRGRFFRGTSDRTLGFGHLHTLNLTSLSPVPSQTLCAWSKHTAFSELRALGPNRINPDTPSTKLEVGFERSLKLEQYFAQKSFQVLVERHGSSLRRLSLVPNRLGFRHDFEPFVFTLEKINYIRAHCPGIRVLELLVPRTKGDAREVGIYRALGQMTQAKHMSLLLDCSDSLINSALDCRLARAIWQEITRPSRHSHPSTLQRLSLQTVGGYNFGEGSLRGDLADFLPYISPRQLCIRSPRDDSDDITIKSFPMPGIPEGEIFCGEDLGTTEPLFRSLWEEKTGSWTTDWHSFPLASD
ncbi:hypothetical protein AJ80_01866 [Polytolypa hystricis UAMH7299]|uniref:Uncharacterized protein n=1 Tax=Polytolypa hystricis (strain UAMH7299) TaxID=1447883 RepID=A0A2B7YZF5_POLH7|nr:hypothetical protein AJ80_01866 [Polytolypa hystricis UAMH7299]